MSIPWRNWGIASAVNGQYNVDEEPDATLPLAADSGVELAHPDDAGESQCCFDAESAGHDSQLQVDLDSQVQVEVQDSQVQTKKRTVASPETGQKK